MSGKVFVTSVECRYGCGKVFYGRSEVDMGRAKASASSKRTAHGGQCPDRFKGNKRVK